MRIRKMALSLITVLLCGLPLFAAPPVPKPSSGGDYWIRNEDTWINWEVVVPDLAGRLTPTWPEDEQSPGALLKVDWMVPKWPVVLTFHAGDRLLAIPDEGGGVLIKDIDGYNWMKVENPQGGFCFVRANSKYIRPLPPTSSP